MWFICRILLAAEVAACCLTTNKKEIYQMSSWIKDSVPIISAIVVAIVPFFSMMQQRRTSIKKMKEYAELLSILDKDSSSRSDIEALLKQQSEKSLERSSRKIDGSAIFATAILAMALGVPSYFLMLGAMRYDGFWKIVCWVLFVVVALLAVLVVAAGSTLIFKNKNKGDDENQAATPKK